MDAPAALSSKTFRDAMARIPAAVHLVTTEGPGGRGGVTVTSVCPVIDTPPTLLICLNRTSRTNRMIRTNGVLAVNTLRRGQEQLSAAFAGQRGLSMDARFAEASWTTLHGSSPVLADGLAAFDCRVLDMREVGSHTAIFAEILSLRVDEAAEALIYADRRYRSLSQ